MVISRSSRVRFVLASIALAHLTCRGDVPTSPQPAAVQSHDVSGGAVALNDPPRPVLRTTPPADATSRPFPTIMGVAPLTVKFNLCRSEDPDPGDSLNELFHFGDSDAPAFNPDGSFNADFSRFCRTEHVYEKVGAYVATIIVTDKHLEDQTRDAVAMAQVTLNLTIIATDAPPPRGPGGPDLGGPSPDPDTLPKVVITIVSIAGDMSFSPNPANVRVGQRVAWQNGDSFPHTATQNGGAFDTGELAPGEMSGTVTIGSPGSLNYHCGIHPSMVGTLNVNP